MARCQDYSCSRCGNKSDKASLTVKKITFFEMGAGGRLIKSRVADWLCPNCTILDPDWQRPQTAGVPRTRRLSG